MAISIYRIHIDKVTQLIRINIITGKRIIGSLAHGVVHKTCGSPGIRKCDVINPRTVAAISGIPVFGIGELESMGARRHGDGGTTPITNTRAGSFEFRGSVDVEGEDVVALFG